MNNQFLPSLITEIVNMAVNVVFFVLFTLRFVTLRAFSKTDRYKDYFPKIRILFCFIYVALTIAFFISNLMSGRVRTDDAIELVLGGVGEIINSVILIIQLLVLRFELLKQQPYTIIHLLYFIYLTIISIIRLIFACLSIPQAATLVVLIIECLFVVDSILQLIYWMIKKQSLPQFKVQTDSEIDQVRNEIVAIVPRQDKNINSYWKLANETFPFIIPTVSVEHGKIRIILQKLRVNNQESRIQDTNESHRIREERLTANHTPKEPLLDDILSQNQIISVNHYTAEQLKSFYVICGRFPLKNQVQFENTPLQKLVKDLQLFLEELFENKRWYQENILKYLKVSPTITEEYSMIVQKLTQSINEEVDMDSRIGLKVLDDKNAIYFSVIIFKHLWVSDHFEYYIKIVSKITNKTSYPFRRYSQFQEFHNNMKNILKTINKEIDLPFLPKKHLFHWNQDEEAKQRRNALEKYLQTLYNDYTIIEIPELKELLFDFMGLEELNLNAKYEDDFYQDLKVIKGEVNKALIQDEYVTFYKFKIFKKGIEMVSLYKRFSDFQQLHKQLLRWMHNIKITYKLINMPQKIYYGSEIIRHQKLKNYLQNLVQIRDIGKLYAINSFFNIYGNQAERLSNISAIPSMQHVLSKSNTNSNVIREVFELVQRHMNNDPAKRDSETSSRRFSQIMDNLGNEQFDQY